MALGVAEMRHLKESGSEPGGVPKLGVFSESRPESMGYCGRCVGLRDYRANAFSYNKRTMDRAMGPF